MNRIFLFATLFLLAQGCGRLKFWQSSGIVASENQRESPKKVKFVLDESSGRLLADIEPALLMPDPNSGDPYFNPGKDHEFLPTDARLPALKFGASGDLTLPSADEWLKGSARGLGVALELRVKGSPKGTTAALIEQLRSSLEMGPNPTSFVLDVETATPVTMEQRPAENTRPYFFTVADSGPALLGEVCKVVSSFLSARQLLAGLRPESSTRVDLECTFHLRPVKAEVPTVTAEPRLRVLSLPFPWKTAGSTLFPFKTLDSFLDPETYSALNLSHGGTTRAASNQN